MGTVALYSVFHCLRIYVVGCTTVTHLTAVPIDIEGVYFCFLYLQINAAHAYGWNTFGYYVESSCFVYFLQCFRVLYFAFNRLIIYKTFGPKPSLLLLSNTISAATICSYFHAFFSSNGITNNQLALASWSSHHQVYRSCAAALQFCMPVRLSASFFTLSLQQRLGWQIRMVPCSCSNISILGISLSFIQGSCLAQRSHTSSLIICMMLTSWERQYSSWLCLLSPSLPL